MLQKFAEDLLKEKGLDGVEPEIYDALVKDLATSANKLINRRFLDKMTNEQLKKFNELIETEPSDKAVQDFIDANVSNKNAVVAAALLEFKSLYLGIMPR